VTGVFTVSGDLRSPRQGHDAALLPDGTVIVAGGWGYEDGPITEIERYDPETGTFKPAGATGSLTTVGPAIASVLTNGQVLLRLRPYDIVPTSAWA
jgi:hypothetical protein